MAKPFLRFLWMPLFWGIVSLMGGAAIAAAPPKAIGSERLPNGSIHQLAMKSSRWTDHTHQELSDRIVESARWIDSFFDDDRSRLEENKTRVKIKLSSFWEDSEGLELKLRASLRLALPAAEDRLHLFLSGEDEELEGIGFDRDPETRKFRRTDTDQTSLGLGFFFKAAKDRNIRGRVGFRYRDDQIVVIPELRWRETMAMTPWVCRVAERVRWYSDTGWESRTTIDLDRRFYRDYLMRTSAELLWSEDDEEELGVSYYLNLSLSKALGPRRAVSFDWINAFQTRPNNHLANQTVQIRYRRSIGWKWFFLEVVPQASFPKEANRRFKPGLVIQFEAFLGHH